MDSLEAERLWNEMQLKSRNSIPLFKNKNFVELCDTYEKATDVEKKALLEKFGEFEIEESESITLKSGVDPKDWRESVNLFKLDSYCHMCMRAVIDLATKLDEGVSPLDAMNYMAGKNAPTGNMKVFIYNTLKDFHPRGEEVMKEWKAYCDNLYGRKK